LNRAGSTRPVAAGGSEAITSTEIEHEKKQTDTPSVQHASFNQPRTGQEQRLERMTPPPKT
jgi:hypothetical protein